MRTFVYREIVNISRMSSKLNEAQEHCKAAEKSYVYFILLFFSSNFINNVCFVTLLTYLSCILLNLKNFLRLITSIIINEHKRCNTGVLFDKTILVCSAFSAV